MTAIANGPISRAWTGRARAYASECKLQAQHGTLMATLGFAPNGYDKQRVVRLDSAQKSSGVLALVDRQQLNASKTNSKNRMGRNVDSVTVPYASRKKGPPQAQGDQRLTPGGALSIDTLEIFYQRYADADETRGPLSREMLSFDELKVLVKREVDWYVRGGEEALVRQLFAVTNPAAGSMPPFEVWMGNLTEIYGNPIRSFSGMYQRYAGGQTTSAGVAAFPGATLTAQEVMRNETHALFAPDPVPPVMIDGEPLFVGLTHQLGVEQLKADGAISDSYAYAGKNPIAMRAVGRVSNTLIIPVTLAPCPAANVARFLTCGEGAAWMAEPKAPEFDVWESERFGRRYAAGCDWATGLTVPYFEDAPGAGAYRRGAVACDFYVPDLGLPASA